MPDRIAVRPELLRWARERGRFETDQLIRRFPQLPAWERGERQPTLKQLEKFADITHTPLGYFFLPEPPVETVPIPDFRTTATEFRGRPSPDLLDTIHAMRRRQAWLREERLEYGGEPLEFVGCARLADPPESIGREMRRVVGFESGWAAEVRTWRDAVSRLRRAIEDLGVMAVINGVVGNNTHRRLNVDEFRGFALCDPYAPLIFVNGSDAKSAQMFTLAHELAHLWLGPKGEGLSGFDFLSPGGGEVETFCNQAAAEFLIPERELRGRWNDVQRNPRPFEAIARIFKVSPIVAGRRAMDLRLVDRETFFEFYEAYIKQEYSRKKGPGAGDFYKNQNTRVGELFAAQVIRAALEGRIGFKEAYDLTGLRGGAFQEYGRRLGFSLP